MTPTRMRPLSGRLCSTRSKSSSFRTRVAADLDDDVAGFEAGLGGGGVAGDFHDEQAILGGELVLFGEHGGELVDDDAELALGLGDGAGDGGGADGVVLG